MEGRSLHVRRKCIAQVLVVDRNALDPLASFRGTTFYDSPFFDGRFCEHGSQTLCVSQLQLS